MKKRNNQNLEQLAALLSVIDEESQRRILGGTASTPTSPPANPNEEDPFAIPGVTTSCPTSTPTDTTNGLTTSPTTGTTSTAPTESTTVAVPPTSTDIATESACCESDLPSSTVPLTTEASTEQALQSFIVLVLPASSGEEELPVCMPVGEPFEEFMNTYMPELSHLFGMDGDTYNGVTIYTERFLYTDNSTISSYTATTTDNCVAMQTGYFMEPAWDLNQSMLEGSDRAIYPGEYNVSPYQSAKFKDNYILEDVPGRSYILIHKGKSPGHTSGCLLPGESYGADGMVNTKDAYDSLNAFLKEYGGDGIRIIINNR